MTAKGKRKKPADLLDQPPPKNIDAEKGALGSIILLKSITDDVERILQPEDFYDEANRILARHLFAMYQAGEPIDPTTLVHRLRLANEYDRIGGAAFLAEIGRSAPVATHIARYAAIVREMADKRLTIEVAMSLLEAGYNGKPPQDSAGNAITVLERIRTDRAAASGLKPVMLNMADVEARDLAWIWPNRIARGKLCLLAGEPGLGKSFSLLDIISRITLGTKFPDCDAHAPIGTAILLSEDDPHDVIRPRLDAAAADVSKVKLFKAVEGRDQAGKYERQVDLSRDIPTIEQALRDTPNCVAVGIDPVSAYTGDIDAHSTCDVRGMLAPLSELAEKYHVAIILVHHLNKSDAPAIRRISGSGAFVAAPRTVFAFARDKRDQTGTRRLMLPVKNNVGPDQTGLAYSLCTRFSPNGVPQVVWEAEPVDISADEALAPDRRPPGPPPEERHEAEQFLLDALANGPRPTKEVEEEAKESRQIKIRTLDRARKKLGIHAFRDGTTGPWMIQLSGTPAQGATQGASSNQGATFHTPHLELGTVAPFEDLSNKNVDFGPREGCQDARF